MADNKEMMSGSGSDSFVTSIQDAKNIIDELDISIRVGQESLKKYSDYFNRLVKDSQNYAKLGKDIDKVVSAFEKLPNKSDRAEASLDKYIDKVGQLNDSLAEYIKLSGELGKDGKFIKVPGGVKSSSGNGDSKKKKDSGDKGDSNKKKKEKTPPSMFDAITGNISNYLDKVGKVADFSPKQMKNLTTSAKSVANLTSSVGGLVKTVGVGTGVITALGLAFKFAFDAGQRAYEKNMDVNRSLMQMGAAAGEFNRSGVQTANELIDIGNKWVIIGENIAEIFEPVYKAVISLVDGLTDLLKDITGNISDALGSDEKKEEKETQYTPANSRAKWYTRNLQEKSNIPESKSLPVIADISGSAKQSGFSNQSAANLAIGTYDQAVKLAKQYGQESQDIAKKLADAWLTGSQAAKEYGVVVDDQVLAGYMATKGVDIVNTEISDAMKQYYRYQLMLEQASASNSDAMQNQIKQWKQLGAQIDKAKGKLFSFDEVINLDAYDPTIPEVGTPNVSYPDSEGGDTGVPTPPPVGPNPPSGGGGTPSPDKPIPPDIKLPDDVEIGVKWKVDPFDIGDYIPKLASIGIGWAVKPFEWMKYIPELINVGIKWAVDCPPIEDVLPEFVSVGLQFAMDATFGPFIAAYNAAKFLAELAEAGGINVPVQFPEIESVGQFVDWVQQLMQDLPILNEQFEVFNGTIQNTMIPVIPFNTELEKMDNHFKNINEKLLEQTGLFEDNAEAVGENTDKERDLNDALMNTFVAHNFTKTSGGQLKESFERLTETTGDLQDAYKDNKNELKKLSDGQKDAKGTASDLKVEMKNMGDSAKDQIGKFRDLTKQIDDALGKWNDARRAGMLTGQVREVSQLPKLPTIDISKAYSIKKLKQQQPYVEDTSSNSMLDYFGIDQPTLREQMQQATGGRDIKPISSGAKLALKGLNKANEWFSQPEVMEPLQAMNDWNMQYGAPNAAAAGISMLTVLGGGALGMLPNAALVNQAGTGFTGSVTGPITGQQLGDGPVSFNSLFGNKGAAQDVEAIYGNLFDRLYEFRTHGFANGGIGTKEIRGASLFENDKKEAVIPLESQRGIDFLANAMKQARADSGDGGGSSITVQLSLNGFFNTDNTGEWTRLAERLAEEIDILKQRRGELGYGATY